MLSHGFTARASACGNAPDSAGTKPIAAKIDQRCRCPAAARSDAARLDDAVDHQAVSAGGGVVVKAVQQDAVGDRSGLSHRWPRPAKAEGPPGRSRCHRSSGTSCPRGEDDDAAGVGVLLEFGVPCIAEADRFGQAIDRRLRAGEEMPALAGIGPLIGSEVVLLSCRGRGRGCRWG